MKEDAIKNHIGKYISLTKEEEALFLSIIRFRKYRKGQFVVQEGDIARHINFVIVGCLKTFHMDEEGQEHIIMFAIENWWTADLGSFIAETPAFFNVQCVEQTELAQINKEDLEKLYVEIPKLERYFRLIIQSAYVSAQKRIINNISLTAKEKYLQFRNQYPDIHQRIPQYMIASYLGFTPEFLSRIRSQIIKEQ